MLLTLWRLWLVGLDQINEVAESLLFIRDTLTVYFNKTGRFPDNDELDASVFAVFTMMSNRENGVGHSMSDLMQNVKVEWEK